MKLTAEIKAGTKAASTCELAEAAAEVDASSWWKDIALCIGGPSVAKGKFLFKFGLLCPTIVRRKLSNWKYMGKILN